LKYENIYILVYKQIQSDTVKKRSEEHLHLQQASGAILMWYNNNVSRYPT